MKGEYQTERKNLFIFDISTFFDTFIHFFSVSPFDRDFFIILLLCFCFVRVQHRDRKIYIHRYPGKLEEK